VNPREALIRRIRNNEAKKGIKQSGEQQAPFVEETENTYLEVNGGIFEHLIKERLIKTMLMFAILFICYYAIT
jgi:hypothetical protein